MSKVMVIAPHPDDETLGCGGTLLRHKKEGDELYWMIVTGIHESLGWTTEQIGQRDSEIEAVMEKYRFSRIFNFKLPTTGLDTVPISKLIKKISDVNDLVEPDLVYMPFVRDVHTDHQIIAHAVQSSIKSFRHPSIRKVIMYETPSETEFNFISTRTFTPNVFVNISQYLDEKVEVMKIYSSEMGPFPFPRSEQNIRALAAFRGSQSSYNAAEAFQLVFERS